MPGEVVFSKAAPAPLSAYSQAIKAGSLLFLAGQIPLDPISGELVTGSIALETDRVIANLVSVLEAAGASLIDVVKVTVYLTSMKDFSDFNAAYARHFPNNPPARSTVAVAELPRGVRIELDAIAVVR
jgi:2-iminobutanoate/2-iminopropanoate deaminase